VLTDMWAPSHMNKIFFEQMLIQALSSSFKLWSHQRSAIKSWPEVMG